MWRIDKKKSYSPWSSAPVVPKSFSDFSLGVPDIVLGFNLIKRKPNMNYIAGIIHLCHTSNYL